MDEFEFVVELALTVDTQQTIAVLAMQVNQKGFTLVELMVAMMVSLIIISGGLYIFTNIIQTSIYEVRSARASEQMRDVLSKITMDLRRAGYRGHELYVNEPSAENIYRTVRIGKNTVDGDCIVFAYNLNDVTTGTSTSHQVFGYRKGYDPSADTLLDSIQVYSSSTADSASLACNSSDWEELTSSNDIESISLVFEKGADCNSITVTLSGKSKTNASHERDVDFNFTEDVEFFNGVELSDQGVACG